MTTKTLQVSYINRNDPALDAGIASDLAEAARTFFRSNLDVTASGVSSVTDPVSGVTTYTATFTPTYPGA